jgi:hypothetical protein
MCVHCVNFTISSSRKFHVPISHFWPIIHGFLVWATSGIILYFSILLHCIVQWVLQVKLPSACSLIVEVSCHCFTLHASAYMAIFRCVGCYYSHVLEGISFAGSSVSCTWLRFCTFHMCFPVLFFSFYFAVPCVRVLSAYLNRQTTRKDKQINTHARRMTYKERLGVFPDSYSTFAQVLCRIPFYLR